MDNIKQKLLKEVFKVLDNNKQGTYNFKKVRKNLLQSITKDIIDLGIPIKSYLSFTNDHLIALLDYWHGKGNTVSTIMNKRAILVWFLKLLGSDINIPRAKDLNLTKLNQPKDFVYISEDIVHKVHHPLSHTILEFQLYFGLTKLESIKINLDEALKTKELYINKRLAFNSNDRFIPIVSDNQRQAIDNRLNYLNGKDTLLNIIPLYDIVALYHTELILNDIPKKADLRKFFIQKNYYNFQNKGSGKKEIYEQLLSLTGFRNKKDLIKVAFS
ncbi:hypothetical protein [Francisella sp. SYW-9]|uniref:hypothetical protein n=1 Tax=Francisella sp. SYW-9 TaxID=2610888 RepID=UPI00168D8501|nr:hypothetical protein [Francisella sp. SYW-9]